MSDFSLKAYREDKAAKEARAKESDIWQLFPKPIENNQRITNYYDIAGVDAWRKEAQAQWDEDQRKQASLIDLNTKIQQSRDTCENHLLKRLDNKEFSDQVISDYLCYEDDRGDIFHTGFLAGALEEKKKTLVELKKILEE